MQSLKSLVALSGDRVNTSEDRAGKTLDKMFELQPLIEGPNRTVSDEFARIAVLDNAEFVLVRSVITAALSKRKHGQRGDMQSE